MVFLTCFCAFLFSSLFLFVARTFDKNPSPIFGVYQRKNGVYWLKVIFMYSILLIRKVKNFCRPRNAEFYKKLDNVHSLPSTPKAVDAVFFNGSNKNGDFFTVGTARRKNRLVDGFLFLNIKSSKLGLLQLPKLPDTSLFNTGEEESFEAEGIKIKPLDPMKKWGLTFEGQLREAENHEKLHDVRIEANWSSDEPWFNYDTDMDPWDMAKAVAYEKWTRSYFRNVKATHQTHYEQWGSLKAKVTIDGSEFNINIEAVRDHSIGPFRDWANFRRYSLHWVTTENGDRFSVGALCMPLTYSRMKFGYMFNAQERKMYPVVDSDLELYRHGEMGTPPKDYAFSFTAGKTRYTMQVNIVDAPYFYISKEWEAKVFECLCTVEVNGVKGFGGVEWEYRNVPGRNIKV